MDDSQDIDIKTLSEADIAGIVNAFLESKWTEKPPELFVRYLTEQERGERKVWLAFVQEKFAGYVTLKWKSQYASFSEQSIPEISDLNVLPQLRRQGVASKLLDISEKEALIKSKIVGIGVGLYADYGFAQMMYIKRGYMPDGYGVSYNFQPVPPGEKVTLDDDLNLWMKKNLTNNSSYYRGCGNVSNL